MSVMVSSARLLLLSTSLNRSKIALNAAGSAGYFLKADALATDAKNDFNKPLFMLCSINYLRRNTLHTEASCIHPYRIAQHSVSPIVRRALRPFQCTPYRFFQLLDLYGLGEKVMHVSPQRLDGRVEIGEGRDHDDLGLGIKLFHRSQNLHPVDPLHLIVGDDHIDFFFLQPRQRRLGTEEGFYGITLLLERELCHIAHNLIIINDHDFATIHRSSPLFYTRAALL